MARTIVNGINLWYNIQGEGELLAQIHGASTGHHNFMALTPLLAKHFKVLDFDMRGYGDSDRPRQKYSMQVWADDLAALLDKLDIHRAFIHGTSMGGMVALQFALSYPEKVRALIVSCSLAKPDKAAKLVFEAWKRMARTWGMSDADFAGLMATQGVSRKLLDEKADEVIRMTMDIHGKMNDVAVFERACDAMIAFDVADQLANIKTPTLIVSGDSDIMTPLEMGPDGCGARVMHKKIRGSKLVVFKNTAHYFLFERPEDTTREITNFLKKVARLKAKK